MSLRGLLFDFNGTLFFDNRLHEEAFRRVFLEHGLTPPTRERLTTTIFGRTNDVIYRENFDPNATQADILAFAERKETLYRSFCLENPELLTLCPGAEEMLKLLKERKIPFALATGSGLDNMEFYWKHLRLDRYFTEKNAVWNDGSFAGKPAPDPYILAAARIGLTPEDCVVFEDGSSGVLSAMRAGAGAIVALYEEGYPSPVIEELRVDCVRHDLLDAPALLGQLGILHESSPTFF